MLNVDPESDHWIFNARMDCYITMYINTLRIRMAKAGL